jgi:hypothetical protein
MNGDFPFHPVDVHVYHHNDDTKRVLNKILKRTENIMATLEELNTVMTTISAEVDKVSIDTDNLLAQLANIPAGGLTPEQQTALDLAVESANSIATRLQTLDDKVPTNANPF